MQRLAILVLAYVPLLLNDPGRVAADTKAYLYLDPGRLMERATSMWQPEVAMGTVTHQNIGYLWPIGPFYWLADIAGMPDWLAQRLWMGSVLAAAGLGVRWLLRTLGWRDAGVLVASLAYMLSPYLLNYVDRHSVILLPWAGLPWMLGLTARALRTPGWRHAAIFGLVTLTVGGVNASSLLLVGLGPALWLLYSGLEGAVPWRRVASATVRIGVAFVATGLWWMVGLAVQAGHGLPTLRLTENYRVVSDAATAPELFRGLGYWYFYGQGRLGAWIEPSTSYTRWALPLSFALPLLALLAAAVVRFRHRGHALMLIVVGILVGIGAHPYDDPSFLGRIFREWTLTDAGLALRSTPRALPLSVLGLAICLGAGAGAVARWRPQIAPAVSGVLCLLVVANLSPLWQGEILGALVQRPEDVPASWHGAADHLEARGSATRVLEIPGSDFAAYRWGNSGDPVLPGLMDRPHVARELIPQGSPASAALLVALDTEIQEGRLDADALAPMARLMGVGDVVLRSDLQFERFRTPRPADLWARVRDAPGFDPLVEFGDPVPNVAGPQRPLLDQHTLSRPLDAENPAPVVVLPVAEPVSILHTADPTRPILISGDAEGIVAAAGEGLLEAGRPLFLTGSFSDEAARVLDLVGPGSRIILTDSNRKDGHRWGTIRETAGYTERSDEQPMDLDLSDYALTVIDDRPGVRTVAVQRGLRVDASGYGNPVTFTPGDRPFHAVDGDPDTAWSVGAFNHVVGERLVLTLDEPIAVAHLVLQQARLRGQNRWISQLAIGLDERPTLLLDLDTTSYTAPGQMVDLPDVGAVSRITLEIRATDVGELVHYTGVTGVGFAEVTVGTSGIASGDSSGIGSVSADETIMLPTDLTEAVRAAGLTDPGAEVAVVLTRQRSDPRDPIRTEPERSMDRTFEVPWDRTFRLYGEARLSAHAPDHLFHAILGNPVSGTATATGSLAGDLVSRARSAFDDDPMTAWQAPIGPQGGHAVTLALADPQEFRDLSLTYRADGLHSAPRTVTVVGDDGPVGTLDLPGTLRDRSSGVIRVPLDLPAFTSRTLTIRIDAVTERRTMNWYSGLPDILPVGIVEVGDGVTAIEASDVLDTGCRSDLVTLDGQPVPVRITGSTVDARARQPLTVEVCDGPLDLAAGSHRLRIRPGPWSGFDLDRVVLVAPSIHDAATDEQSGPELLVTAESRTSIDITTNAINSELRPFWLVLGQSHSDGWRLTLDGATVDGTASDVPPVLIDGFANGWLVTPASGIGGSIGLHLQWTPQRLVWLGLGLSLIATVGCLLVAWRGRRDIGAQWPEPPRFVPGHRRRTTPVGLVTATLSAAAVGGFALVNLPGGSVWLWAAPFIALSTWAGLRGVVPQRTTALVGLASMGVATTWIAVDQIRFRFPRDFVWPLFFDQVHVLGVVAVLLLAAAAGETLLERRNRQD
jgi:arabinofuranan 3-O-arabinosyltransferase